MRAINCENLSFVSWLYWADEPDKEVDFRCEQPLAFDPNTKALWVYDHTHHRLLRVKNPDDFKGKLLVDAVIGQKNKTDGALNRGMDRPDAASLGDVNDVRFDHSTFLKSRMPLSKK